MEWIIAGAGAIIGLYFILKAGNRIRDAFAHAELYREIKPRLDAIDSEKVQFARVKKEAYEKFNSEKVRFATEKKDTYEHIEKITRQRSMGFPWLAEAYADYFALKDEMLAKLLLQKRPPAPTAAEVVRAVKKEKRDLVRANRINTYKLHYLEKLFPWISEFVTEHEDEEILVLVEENDKEEEEEGGENEDGAKKYLSPDEYRSLPSIERNQMALDRYLKSRNKSKWALGRDYEMFVGHLFSTLGYNIQYRGIIDGFEDLGRDVIATKGSEVCIIQCKYWAQYKEIHEKHVFQLFGTTVAYWVSHFCNNKKPEGLEAFSKTLNAGRLRSILFTSTHLSKTAKEMAQALGVEIVEMAPLDAFPRIKCNVNVTEKTRIYHLPMDQQYDRTIIDNQEGGFYAYTVKEAEDAGFRRAFKHRF